MRSFVFLRKFAQGPRDKIDLPILEQAADEIEGLRALLRECKPFLFDASGVPTAPEDLRERVNTTPKSKSEDQTSPAQRSRCLESTHFDFVESRFAAVLVSSLNLQQTRKEFVGQSSIKPLLAELRLPLDMFPANANEALSLL
jgi:hypothetical protein